MGLRVGALVVSLLMLASCSSSSSGSLDLQGEATIGAGTTIETRISDNLTADQVRVVGMPVGSTASIKTDATDGALFLEVKTDPDMPRGSYSIGLETTSDGEADIQAWAFTVTD